MLVHGRNRHPVANRNPPARFALLDEVCRGLSADRTPAQCNERQAPVLADDATGYESIFHHRTEERLEALRVTELFQRRLSRVVVVVTWRIHCPEAYHAHPCTSLFNIDEPCIAEDVRRETQATPPV